MDLFDLSNIDLPFNPVEFTRYLNTFSGVILFLLVVGVAFHALAVVFGVIGVFVTLGVAMALAIFLSVFLATE